MVIASTVLVKPDVSGALESDEFEEIFDDAAIGIELEDVRHPAPYVQHAGMHQTRFGTAVR